MATISQIKLPDNVTYELAPKEENIKWGGNNIVGSVSPIGMSLSADHSANRIAFINGDLLSVEGSTDNGNTWTDYGLSKGAKTAFCTYGQHIHIGTNSVEACTLNSKTRITLTAQNGSSPSNTVYTNPKKLLVNVSTANGLEVLIEVRTGTNYLNDGAWARFGTYTVSGWSGWNDIPLILGTLGGGSTQTGNYWQLRLTFSVTSLHSGEQYRSNCYVSGIRIYGDNTWITPSNMARHNHIYNYDYEQNTTFPANVTAPKFIGALQGNADTATNATKVNNHTVNKDVPSDAVFTDQNVKQTATTSSESNTYPFLVSSVSSGSTGETKQTHNLNIRPSTGTVESSGGTFRAIASNDTTKYIQMNGWDIYNSKTWDGTNTSLTDTLRNKQDILLGGNIESGNLNNYKNAGYYYVEGIVSNTPSTYDGILEVITKDITLSEVVQRYTERSSGDILGVYERVYSNSSWTSWKRISNEDSLPLTGGTLTGDLKIEKVNPVYYTRKTNFAVDTSANNGLSSDTASTTNHADSTGYYFSRFRGTAYTDGRIASLIDARNMKTDGTRVSNYLSVGVNKDGTRYFAMPNDADGDARAAFRDAIKIQDTPTTSLSNGTETSVATGTDVTLNSRTLAAGVWIIIYKVTFGANATGYRRAYLANSDTSTSAQYQSRLTQPAVNSSSVDTEITMANVVNLSSSTTLYLRCRQNSGSTLSCTGAIRCVRLNPIS